MKDLAAFLEKTDAFICSIRSWWSGENADAAMWWRDSRGCHRRIIKTGEMWQPGQPFLDKQAKVSEAEFDSLMDGITAETFASIPQQPKPIAIGSNSDDRYGFKAGPDDSAHWLDVAGSVTEDRRIHQLGERIFRRAPELLSDD